MRPDDKEGPEHVVPGTQSPEQGDQRGVPLSLWRGNQQFLSWSTDGGWAPGRTAVEATVKRLQGKNLKALNRE